MYYWISYIKIRSFTDIETNPDNVEVLYPEEHCFILERSMSKALEGQSAQFSLCPAHLGWSLDTLRQNMSSEHQLCPSVTHR